MQYTCWRTNGHHSVTIWDWNFMWSFCKTQRRRVDHPKWGSKSIARNIMLFKQILNHVCTNLVTRTAWYFGTPVNGVVFFVCLFCYVLFVCLFVLQVPSERSLKTSVFFTSHLTRLNELLTEVWWWWWNADCWVVRFEGRKVHCTCLMWPMSYYYANWGCITLNVYIMIICIILYHLYESNRK